MDSAATQQTFKKRNTNVSGSKENDGKAGGGGWKYGKEGGGSETKRRKHGMGEESEETKMTISLLKEGKETVKHCLQAAVSQASSEYRSPLCLLLTHSFTHSTIKIQQINHPPAATTPPV